MIRTYNKGGDEYKALQWNGDMEQMNSFLGCLVMGIGTNSRDHEDLIIAHQDNTWSYIIKGDWVTISKDKVGIMTNKQAQESFVTYQTAK